MLRGELAHDSTYIISIGVFVRYFTMGSTLLCYQAQWTKRQTPQQIGIPQFWSVIDVTILFLVTLLIRLYI